MQILTNTREKLVLEERFTFFAVAAWISAMTLGYGLVNKWAELGLTGKWGIGATGLAFAAAAIFFLRPSVFEFNRADNYFRWIKPGLFRSYYGETPLDKIKRVRVDADYDEDTKAYRVLIETQGETVPFQHCYTTSEADYHQKIAELIRNWLAR